MTLTDFSTTLLVDQTPKEVFQAINNVRGWWSEEIEGGTHKLNDEFTYHYKEVHHCKMKLIEVVPERRVAWLVLDNYFSFTKDKSEWKGTTISFDISNKDGQTQMRFTHQGLVSEYECFDICSNAWTDYIQNSLRKLIVTGKGTPNKDEQDYQKIMIINKPVHEVYAAITEDIPQWWSNDFTGAAAQVGDHFNIAFGGTRKTFEIIEAIPDEFVAWKCIKAYIDVASLKNKSEWVDTKILWTFSSGHKETTINFMHQGLHKSLECYEVCEAGWDQFLGSLESYLKTGNGKPYLKSPAK